MLKLHFSLLSLGAASVLVTTMAMRSADAAAPQAASAGHVLSLVIGVTNYDDGKVDDAAPSAKKFADAVMRTYPFSKQWLLRDEKATEQTVRKILFEDIPRAPAGSLIIFYFAGHGSRLTYNNPAFDSDLFLVLIGIKRRHAVGIRGELDTCRRRFGIDVPNAALHFHDIHRRLLLGPRAPTNRNA
jgi:hypothetical protein